MNTLPLGVVFTNQIYSWKWYNYNYNYAGGGEDYNSGPYSVKFNDGMTEATLNVSIVDDSILEGNEKFNLIVNVSSLPSKVSIGDHGRATVTIVDNDGNIHKTLRLYTNTYNISCCIFWLLILQLCKCL